MLFIRKNQYFPQEMTLKMLKSRRNYFVPLLDWSGYQDGRKIIAAKLNGGTTSFQDN